MSYSKEPSYDPSLASGFRGLLAAICFTGALESSGIIAVACVVIAVYWIHQMIQYGSGKA